jgi:DNA-binding IclR family transcriptional regulator
MPKTTRSFTPAPTVPAKTTKTTKTVKAVKAVKVAKTAQAAKTVKAAKAAVKRGTAEQSSATLAASEIEGAAAVPLEVTSLDMARQLAGTQTLLRGLAMLEAAASGAHDLRAFATVLGTTRSTTHRLVSSLVQARYLRQLGGVYLLGPKLIELGTIALEQMPLTKVAHPHLERLANATQDTIHLGVRDGDDVLYIDKIPGRRGLEMRSRIGHRMPLASTGIGKALMLDLGEAQWSELFAASCRTLASMPFKPDLQPTPLVFLGRMTRYAAGGYAFDLEENEASIRCVAAPIRDASGAIVAALSVASTLPYMPDARMEELIAVVQAQVRAISEEIGWRAPRPTIRRIRR